MLCCLQIVAANPDWVPLYSLKSRLMGSPQMPPATITFLVFVLEVLVRLRLRDHADKQWCDTTQKKFQDPDVTLKSYGGHKLELIAHIEFSISVGDKQVKSVVLVKKDSPNNLLIGTDVQPKLGFSVVVTSPDSRMPDLLSGEEVVLHQSPQQLSTIREGRVADPPSNEAQDDKETGKRLVIKYVYSRILRSQPVTGSW